MGFSQEDLGQVSSLGVIMREIKQLVIERIHGAREHTVILSDDPNNKLQTPSDSTWYVVTPSPQGNIDMAAMAGGGPAQMTTATRVIVTAHIPYAGDDPNTIDNYWTIFEKERLMVLRALSFQMIYDSDGNRLLNDVIIPAEWNWNKAAIHGSVQVAFDLEYDEDISDELTA